MAYGEVVDLALYHEEHGFYASGGRAGRRGDFLTSPEVGPLFGHIVANALDAEWDRLGQPGTFTVIDWGAGPGTLLRSIERAKPRCSPALRRVAVEWSPTQRELHDEGVESVRSVQRGDYGGAGVVVANELLDNLAFNPVRIEGEAVRPSWVDLDSTNDELREISGDLDPSVASTLFSPGSSSAVYQPKAAQWLQRALDMFDAGRVLVFDYARSSSSEVAIRTFAEHGNAGDPLANLGTKDVTVDVDLFQLQVAVRHADMQSTQAAWLVENNISHIVEEGRRIWDSNAATGTLEALLARSRVRESEALMDPSGLGGFITMEWVI